MATSQQGRKKPTTARKRGAGAHAREDRNDLVPYLVKSAAIVVVLFLLSLVLPIAPIWVVAPFLALMSLIPATGSIYRTVVNRTFRQNMFEEGSIHTGNFLLRIPLFIVFYFMSAVSMASIFMESPTWKIGMWATVILAIPIYRLVLSITARIVKNKEKAIPLVRDARAARISVIATGVLLCILLFVITLLQPSADYSCAADAFMAVPKPFENSPSALMREAGELAALTSGLSSYALAKLSESSWYVFLALHVILNAAAMFGVAGMLSVCFIQPQELKRAFVQLEVDDTHVARRPVVKPFCIVFALLPILVTAGLISADAYVQDTLESNGETANEYTFAKKFIQDQVSLVVYEFDGKYYNPAVVDEVLAKAKEESQALSLDAEQTLIPLINESFDKRIENVDSYLDWYYSPLAELELASRWATGTAEDYAKEQFMARIDAGIDDSELNEAIEQFQSKAEALKSETLSKLSQYELTDEYPSWLVKDAQSLEEVVSASLDPSQELVGSLEQIGLTRMAGSSFAGLAGNIIVLKVDELLNRETYKAELISEIEKKREETIAAIRAAADSSMTS